MKKTDKLVTYKEAIKLRILGYDEECCHYCMIVLEESHQKGRKFNCLCKSYPENWNNKTSFISIPTYIDATRWLIDKKLILLPYNSTLWFRIRTTNVSSSIRVIRKTFRDILKYVISSTKSTKSK